MAPPILNVSVPHGIPRTRGVVLTASKATTLITTSRPRVITAIEKMGSPIIGRMVKRSMTRPTTPVAAAARISAINQWNHQGPPIHRPGTSQSMKMIDNSQVPARAKAP